MFRNQSANVHQFSFVPRNDVPRSGIRIESTHKTTFDAGYLIPVYVEEVLPGDTFNLHQTLFARMATPLFPIMDNLYIDWQWFFCPNRLLWENWEKFMGEQDNPGDSTEFIQPYIQSPLNGYQVGTIFDQMGLPTVGQVAVGATVITQVLPLRMYNRVWNEWYRDQNLQDSVPMHVDDGPDPVADYTLLRRGKRHDYFTSCLPFLQKGTAVPMPVGTSAPVVPLPGSVSDFEAPSFRSATDETVSTLSFLTTGASSHTASTTNQTAGTLTWDETTGLYADLAAATGATINLFRQSIMIQSLMEKDARGGTRYAEIVRSHFGVISPDARLQRPEYLGGGSQAIAINPVSQTAEAGSAPVGTQGAYSTVVARGGFTQSFTEHGFVMCLASVRADLTYQQGVRRMWFRGLNGTKYEHYWPSLAQLGEQAVLSQEIFADGTNDDADVFGYQSRWSEYQHHPSTICGLFRSTIPSGSLDVWHLSQEFATRPVLDDVFIQENPPINRVTSVNGGTGTAQFIMDAFFVNKAARPLPLYSVPATLGRF